MNRASLKTAELICGRQVTTVDRRRAEWLNTGIELVLSGDYVVFGDKEGRQAIVHVSSVGAMEPAEGELVFPVEYTEDTDKAQTRALGESMAAGDALVEAAEKSMAAMLDAAGKQVIETGDKQRRRRRTKAEMAAARARGEK